MHSSNQGKQLFTEAQIGELIQRATELHEESSGSTDGALTLEDVEHIAEELGISAEHVRTAALELSTTPAQTKKFSLFGAPFSVNHARVVNEPMTEKQWELIVAHLRRSATGRGQVDSIGDTREWSRTVEDAGTVLYGELVSARSEDGQTSVSLSKRFGGLAFMAYFFGAMIWFLGSLALLENLDLPQTVNFILFAAAGVGVFATVRAGIAKWKARQLEHLKSLADKIQLTISSRPTVRSVQTPAIDAVHEPQIQLPEEESREESAVKTNLKTRS